MSFNLPLREMTVQEKRAAMESLWGDLTRTPEAIESPAWHKDILDDSGRWLAEGQSRFIDWKQPKPTSITSSRENRDTG